MSDSAEELVKQAGRLVMQSKKNAVFRETLQEAEKISTAGSLFLQAAVQLADGEDRDQLLKSAATHLSRAKRLVRKFLKERE